MAARPARRLAPSPTPFADAALELHSYGLAVIPLGGDDGKVPQRRFAHWKHRPGRQFLEDLIPLHPNANVGVLTGLSGYTVVDIDDPALTDRILAKFGDTPLQIATPSGGVHLWYRANGERCRNLRASDGLAVDIKAKGGMVVVPPSVRPTGPHAGKVYGFISGSWDDLPRLPGLKAGSLYDGDRVYDGTRNDSLFRYCMRQVQYCDTLDDLIDVADTFNRSCVPPLPVSRVVSTARSAWGYEQDGKNWIGGPPQVVFTAADVDRFRQAGDADAFLLLAILKRNHGARPDPFAVAAREMARDKVIGGWARDRCRNATNRLVKYGDLKRVYQGGKKSGDPSKYRLAAKGSSDPTQ